MSERTNKNDLVAFAGPVFDLILRVKAGIVAPSNELRPQVAAMLADFEKLDAMLKQIETTQDAVEIYYVCMLLGFKGRYGVYEQEKLLAIMQTTANALVKVGKIKPVELSPHWLANDQPEPPKKRGMPVWAKIGALSGLGLAFIVYLLMFLFSSKFLDEAMRQLQL